MNRLLHLGVGNFHRAHQAWYTEMANRADDDVRWRIQGVSLRSATVRDALRTQDYAYTLSISDAQTTALERIDVIDSMLVAPDDSAAVIAAIASPTVSVVTLTVTEKGYHLANDGSLDLNDPAIVSDLEAQRSGKPPATTIGLLSAGLAQRAGTATALTVLSCDNLVDNGRTLRRAVVAYADAAGLGIINYLDAAVAFPCCMVDRITPATDEALTARVAGTTLPPALPVATERFSEWVIEDRFAGPRPRWELAGAVFTDDVGPFERRKLGMLNGAHSLLAYAGTLAGHTFVHEAIADPALNQAVRQLMNEAAATLPDSVRDGAGTYAGALLDRFANPGLEHRLRQIAMDGSLKLPIRILDTLRARRALGLDSPGCEATLHAWRDFLVDELAAGRPLDDPAAARLTHGDAAGDDVWSLLGAVADRPPP